MGLFKPSLSKILQSIQQNSIEFTMKNEEDKPSAGFSKIGGKPHVPSDFVWPYYTGTNYDEVTASRPLSFLAQFDLSEVAEYDADGLLPHTGYLYFFYDLDTMCWGFDPKDIGCARVFYYDVSASALTERDFPDGLDKAFYVPESPLSFKSVPSLPSFEEYDDLYGGNIDCDKYAAAAEKLGADPDRSPEDTFKLLGYADIIQNSMLMECEMTMWGIYSGNPPKLTETQKKTIKENSYNWTLLAQFGTLSDELMFGDCGCIYYYIRSQDLAERNFDKIHLILQCY